MVLAAPELVVPETVELLDEVEITTELQHRMLADRMVRGEKGAKIQSRHSVVSVFRTLGPAWPGHPRSFRFIRGTRPARRKVWF